MSTRPRLPDGNSTRVPANSTLSCRVISVRTTRVSPLSDSAKVHSSPNTQGSSTSIG